MHFLRLLAFALPGNAFLHFLIAAARWPAAGTGRQEQVSGSWVSSPRPSLSQADDGTRTRYLQLGKLALYQVSYIRALATF